MDTNDTTTETYPCGDVTYSPQDDKLRIYFATRQGDDVLAPLKEAGFRWAGAQECWHAHWTPKREDAALAATGTDELRDEESSLEDRAAARSERFRGYSGSAAQESAQARKVAQDCTDCIPPGQPILVGHHSERRHRRALERADNAMRKCIEAGKRSGYWQSRAAGSVRWASYKERADVRARRIKTLQAEARRYEREIGGFDVVLAEFVEGAPFDRLWHLANGSHGHSERLPIPYGVWSRLDKAKEMDPFTSAAEVRAVVAEVRASAEANRGQYVRWLEHVNGRLEWEREQLRMQGAEALIAPKPRDTTRAKLPILNLDTPECFRMTAAEYARINKDYKGTRIVGNRYRIRVAVVGSQLGQVFLADKRTDTMPTE